MKRTLLLLALCSTLSGCVVFGGGSEVVYDEARRMRVSFASLDASSDFYNGMELADEAPFSESGGIFVIGLALVGGETFYETQFYNAQLRMADVNRDTIIDDAEAEHYLQRMVDCYDDEDCEDDRDEGDDEDEHREDRGE